MSKVLMALLSRSLVVEGMRKRSRLAAAWPPQKSSSKILERRLTEINSLPCRQRMLPVSVSLPTPRSQVIHCVMFDRLTCVVCWVVLTVSVDC